MGASAGQLLPPDRRSTTAARFSATSIDPGLASIVAIHPFKIAEITKGSAAGSNADGQNIDQRIAQPLQFFERQLPCGCEGSDARCEKGFIRIDVARPGHQGLVQQSCFDRSAAALELLLQVGGGEVGAEWFRAESYQACDHLFNRLAWRHPPHLPEAAHIHKAQLLLFGIPEANTGVLARF